MKHLRLISIALLLVFSTVPLAAQLTHQKGKGKENDHGHHSPPVVKLEDEILSLLNEKQKIFRRLEERGKNSRALKKRQEQAGDNVSEKLQIDIISSNRDDASDKLEIGLIDLEIERIRIEIDRLIHYRCQDPRVIERLESEILALLDANRQVIEASQKRVAQLAQARRERARASDREKDAASRTIDNLALANQVAAYTRGSNDLQIQRKRIQIDRIRRSDYLRFGDRDHSPRNPGKR